MNSLQDLEGKLKDLRTYLRSVRGPGWNAFASRGTHETCVKVERVAPASEAEAVSIEYCGENFDAAAAKIRQQFRDGNS